jgi:deoxyribodipyrimidine photolyase-like uncharacterized protein
VVTHQEAMKKIAIIFPHQLFAKHPALSVTRDVHLIEDRRFFTDFRFHRKKLLFHRESMLALFGRFFHKYRKVLGADARMRIMTMQLQRMGKKKIRDHAKIGEKLLVRLFT